ncbi:MAG: hypothetical protein KJ798_02245 [Gammaproteobacteria bacterium]|nr:hypothetical protein [Gammaproteobacteria bacterium]MBU0849797.1 hypothetical protein [Gammaproteobacteria bacterium]MBU1267107.1 hypothetical protein [Gammaproteobacteria bacterium]MBU1527586.1 hypothetical protein [Gammaproteobacteria bacterium]MBU1779182.1 hypothetical protein [Gammaproteobacteria bacterium]
MKKFVFLAVVLLSVYAPLKAALPALALVVSSTAGSASVATASSFVGTVLTGLSLTGLALISAAGKAITIKWPTTDGNGTAAKTFLYADPGASTASQLSGSCTVYIKVQDLYNGTSTPSAYDWKVQANTNCTNWQGYDNPSVADSCNGNYQGSCVHKITSWKMACRGTGSCGLINGGQVIESTDNAARLATEKGKLNGSTIEDNKIALEHENGVLKYDLDDPQVPATVGGETGYPAPLVGGGMAVQYENANGQNTVVVQQPVSNGHTVTEYNQLQDNSVQVSEIAVTGTGTVSSHSTAPTSGYVNPLPTTAPGQQITYAPVVTTNPGGTVEPTPNPTPNPNFPSDYARAGEAALAAQHVANAINSLTEGDVIEPAVDDVDMPWFGDTFSGAIPTINTSGATCPVWQFDALGDNFYIDHHCTLIADFNPLFYAMFTGFWVLLAFRTVMEA